ncbi:MAG TPA: four-carbon acid sugar kinase family protein, partial [Anseongella sp.]|nr:four-carbon acid sugar kinase family protein [Anseongella sp.]
MIGVIADDFTGAAEIGGLGLRHGLKVEISTSIVPAFDADLLIIATDTRSKDAGTAVKEMREITSGLRDLHPSLLYKKLDSVLRGHVLPELSAQMEVLGRHRVLIVPANPAFERIIDKGIYYVKGKRLHETGFGLDPEFAIGSSHIMDILKGDGQDKLVLSSPGQVLPSRGFIVGEVNTAGDLGKWAKKVDGSTLAAGASGFFSALLDHLGFNRRAEVQGAVNWGSKRLFICGSSFSASKQVMLSLLDKGLPVSVLPRELSEPGPGSAALVENVALEMISLLSRHDYAILSAGAVNGSRAGETARVIRENMAEITERVMRRTEVNELLLEGGATAS